MFITRANINYCFHTYNKNCNFFSKKVIYEQQMNLSKIKDIAKDQGKTLGSVAAAVGITHAGLNTLMKENSTRVDTLLKIANYLGVSITEFFDEEDTDRLSV